MNPERDKKHIVVCAVTDEIIEKTIDFDPGTPMILEGYIDDVDVNKVVDFEKAMHDFMHSQYKDLLDNINDTGDYNDEIEASLAKAIEDFKAKGTW